MFWVFSLIYLYSKPQLDSATVNCIILMNTCSHFSSHFPLTFGRKDSFLDAKPKNANYSQKKISPFSPF